MCYLQDIRDCPGPQSALMDLNSQVKEKFNKLRLRIQVRPHLTGFLLKNRELFLFDMFLLLTGPGADGQRAGQRVGWTGHPGRDREPPKANAEVC